MREVGTDNLEKVIVLKDKSLFYSVKVTYSYFVFSAIGNNEHTIYDTWNNPERYYLKGLNDVKKVFGEPINIYIDTTFETRTNDFYFWKVNRKKGFFFVYYSIGYANRGLTLNIYKFDLESDVRHEIENELSSQQGYRNRAYYIRKKDLISEN